MAETEKTNVTVTIVGNKSRKPACDNLKKLAEKLKCSLSGLVWYAVDDMLKKPPTKAPAGSLRAFGATGAAAGFWVVVKLDKESRMCGVEVREVTARSEIKAGRIFFRYDRDEEKTKARALKAAKQEAASLLELIGLKILPEVLLLKVPEAKKEGAA